MQGKTFIIPKDHELKPVLRFGTEITAFTETHDEYIYDFQGRGLDTPFGMSFLAFAIRGFIEAHPQAKYRAVNYQEREYAAHMGYFQ